MLASLDPMPTTVGELRRELADVVARHAVDGRAVETSIPRLLLSKRKLGVSEGCTCRSAPP
jgi:hypothetical protein